MKNKQTHPRVRWPILAVILGIGPAVGCAPARLEFTSYKDAYFPEKVQLPLQTCAFRTQPSGDIDIAGRGVTKNAEGETTQYLSVHIFWRPKPGKTYADSTTTDALLRYVVVTPNGTLTYAGTGFVFPKKTFGNGLAVDVESSRLRLESQTGTVNDALGDICLAGKITPSKNATVAVDLAREIELAAPR
jgi:hypothetical protein